jgi:glycosyltransferase involved in cell wall biosynthesis
MNLIIISPFWNSPELTKKCIESLKNQYYTNFKAYFIDDVSTDNSYNVAKETIGGDDRFVLIKNKIKKHKTKNFIDIIRNNNDIKWDDVIIELDGDDRLSDNFVLGRLNKVFMDENIWVCGSKWKDQYGKIGNYGKPKPHRARKTSWNFSHLRTFRSFLFNLIDDEDLQFEGSYFKAACDLGHGIPILEMCGKEHFHYIDEPLYTYIWHDRQSYSDKTDFKDKTLQGRTAKYIYSLKSYLPVTMGETTNKQKNRKKFNSIDVVIKYLNEEKIIKKERKDINYSEVNKSLKSVKNKEKRVTIKQNKPNNRNDLFKLKKEISDIIKGFSPNETNVIKQTKSKPVIQNTNKVYIPKNTPSKRVEKNNDGLKIQIGSVAELANKWGFGDSKRKKGR